MSVTALHDDHHDHGPAKGLMRWVTTTNHKDIGTLYLVTSLVMFMVGGAMALVIRAELFEPGMQFVDPMFFNSMTTLHALIMVFGAVMPAFAGLANWMIPMMIGSPDMALPRLNNWSFWLLPFAALMLVSTLFMEGGRPPPVGRYIHRWSCKLAQRFPSQSLPFTYSGSRRFWRRSTLL